MSKFNGTLYHGSGRKFAEFDFSKLRVANDFYGGPVYFTDTLSVAISYAKSMARVAATGTPFVYTCRVVLTSVFDVDHVWSGKELQDILPKGKELDRFVRGAGLASGGKDPFMVAAQLELAQVSLTGDQIFKGLSSGMTNTKAAREYLMDKGYDGLRYNGGLNMNMREKHNVFCPYKASAIKIEKVQRIVKKTS